MLYTQADIKAKDGKIEGIASTSVMDRQNEVVSVDGWDLKNFKKNPVMLWGHDHSEPAIGKVTKIYFDGEGKKKSLKFQAVFQEVTEKARAIKKLVEDGIINSFSVGFKMLEAEGDTITKQELLEISVVNVPANPDARLLAYKSLKDDFDDKTIKEIGIEVEDENTNQTEQFATFEAQLKETKEIAEKALESAESAVQGLKHLNPLRSKHEVIAQRLALSKVIARTSDKLLEGKPQGNTALMVKTIKRSSELLIRSNKGDL